ncbi:conserved hypothetical protein [Candida tropicalis MYA-3404]|uniref:Uncharacterized protein n=1 Tax=Candida tropicalis (strain ATCC MYA-3404 / T1) TaxID=294747 RepID=C5M979_CANTT|nr:conserved hypothetical protein [Candida tropicalis MYA-3404]EER34133.1 conserved hypothetical protein [Candida tropicalis MYA-3404]KAG4407998.1 hypothetical protein JTP64_003534 [Candida tropicalis]
MPLPRSEITLRLNRCNQLHSLSPSTQSQNIILSRDLNSPHISQHEQLRIPSNNVYKSFNHLRFCSSQVKFSKIPYLKNEFNEDDKKELERKINLNRLIDKLKENIPDILETSLPKSLISKDIYLRICPSQVDENYVPKLNGQVTYYTTCKAIQLFLTSVMLSPKVKLHIHSIRVANGPDPQCMFNDTTKLFVRWSTCHHGCTHLEEHGTSEAHLGTHKWSQEDTKKIFDNHKSISSILSKLPGTIMGLTKEPKKLERVLSGLFIFELDEDNTKVLVHTIENMEIIERFEPKEADDVNALRVC